MDWNTFRERVAQLYSDAVNPFYWTISSKLIKQRGPYIMDWWGFYVIKLQWKEGTTDSPFGNPTLEVLLEEEKDSSLTEVLQTVEITSPPGVDVFEFIYIDKLSFAFIEVTAFGFYVPIIGPPQEVRNVDVPVGAVAIVEGYSDWEQDYDVFYFRAHHNGLVPITKDEATRILTSQFIESVGCGNHFPSASPSDGDVKLSRVHRDGPIEINISGQPKFTHEEYDYVEVNGKWVYKFEDELTFHLKVTPDMLDDKTRPMFEELIRKRS